jgi:protein arginine kinase activator
MPILKRIQGRTEHSGKVPKKIGGQIWLSREIKRLKDELNKAVAEEAYERAAQLRDKIRELEGKPVDGQGRW